MEQSNASRGLAIKADNKWAVDSAAHEIVCNMRAQGCAIATIAAKLEMPTSTFRDVMERDDDLKSAFDQGTAEMHDELVNLLMVQAREGYAPAAMFLLKASHGYRENTPVRSTDKQTVNIIIPPAATADELMKLTSVMKDITPTNPAPEPPRTNSKGIIR